MHQDATDSTARVAVAFDVPVDAVELLSDRLFSAGASAVAEMPRPDGLVTLIADLDPTWIDSVLGPAAPRPRLLEPQAAWNQGWREFAVAWECGDRVVLRPEWVTGPTRPSPSTTVFDGVPGDAAPGAAAPHEPVEVWIEPGDAFGSGSHVTTRLCAEQVGELLRSGDRVLDVGCGTGVLGVAAAMLGARSVTSIDVDAEAVRVTRLVADRNGVTSRLHASDTPLAEVDGTNELVLANLLVPIIEDLGADLAARVAPGGHLIASGVLFEQQERVVSALAPLILERVTVADGWVAMVFASPRGGGGNAQAWRVRAS